MHGVPSVVIDSAAAVLLLGAVITVAQWLLRHIYGEPDATEICPSEDCSCHQPK